MIIAIDGPAGTGKSTIASILAEKLNITFSFFSNVNAVLGCFNCKIFIKCFSIGVRVLDL